MGHPLFVPLSLDFSAPPSTHNPSHAQIQSLPTFRAPAHKHAHHLHSIPPREKSTRTLIIDHMLWVHARTRFAQARAELGMTDPTGGPSSSNYVHRRRPENYDEDDEALSESEDPLFLKSRSGWPGPTHDDDDADHLSKQDLSLARGLRLRAEGLESVITSMLDQPPPTDDSLTSPKSPRPTATSPTRTGMHPHTLPNGVRLRLALATVINDLFARQAPPQPYRHTHPPKPLQDPHPHSHPSHHSLSDLPEPLLPLVHISGAFSPTSVDNLASSSEYTTHLFNTTYSNTHLHNQRPVPCSRTISYYASGSDPATANSPPSLRCPRHLHSGCEICVEAKSAHRPTSNRSPSRHSKTSGSSNIHKSPGVGPTGGGIAGWQDGSGIGSGLLRPGIKGNVLRRHVYDDDTNASVGDSGNKNSTAAGGNVKLTKLIPRFLRLSALVAAELGQEARDGVVETDWETTSSENPTTAPSSPVVPRAHTPSKARGKERDEERERRNLFDNALRPTRGWYMLLAGLLTRAVLEGYLTAGWCGWKPVESLLLLGIGVGGGGEMMGSGGRTTSENKGVAKEAVLSPGSDAKGDTDHDDLVGDEEEFIEFDPDGLPSLDEAARVLFPSLNSDSSDADVGPAATSTSVSPASPHMMTSAATGVRPVRRKGVAEVEYEAEMYERLRRFYDIPNSTPDLSTHMEDLAWSYPAEPVERAAVRFCEAVAKWRGKPELETYKKKPSGVSIDPLGRASAPAPTPATTYGLASLDSIFEQSRAMQQAQQSPPQSRMRRALRKPSVDMYFEGVLGEGVMGRAMGGGGGLKRGRELLEDVEGVKRHRVRI